MRNKLTQQRAAILRKNLTDAERHLWHALRHRQISQAKFRRQFPIGPYVTDFACVTARIVIELDGGQHQEHTRYDQQRDHYLQQHGFRVLRFWNNEVLQNLEGVLVVIQRVLVEAGDRPPP